MTAADYIKQYEPNEIGIALSGGGVKGMAHVGVLKALEEVDVTAQYVTGASAGALVGALYAQGATIDEMLYFFKETPLFRYNFFTISKPGLFDTEKYLTILDKHISASTFDDLKKRLTVVATDLEQGQPHYFSEGELLRPVLASAALPPVFSPVTIDGVLYSDGGIMDNFPIEPIVNKVACVIGSYTSTARVVTKKGLDSSYKLTTRVNNLMLHANVMRKLHLCDVLCRPEGLESIAVLDKKGIDKAFAIGYEAAARCLDQPFESKG